MKKRIFFSLLTILLLAISLLSLSACKKNEITHIEAEFSGSSLTVYEGQSLEVLRPCLSVYAVNGRGEKTAVADYSLFGTLNAGTSTVTVSYLNFTDTFTVQVTDVKLASISATYNQNGKTVYTSNTLDSLKADLSVVGTNNDGSTLSISDYTLFGDLTAGTATVTVSYGGCTDTFTVTVTAVVPTSIQVSTPPSKTHYIETERIELSILVLYNDGSSQTVTDFVCDKEIATLGDTEITVSCLGLSTTVPITVEKKVTSLSISKNPEKLSYIVGERLELSGIEITAHYLDGSSAPVTLIPSIADGTHLAYGYQLRYTLQAESVTVPLQISYKEYEDYLLSVTYGSSARSLIADVLRFRISKYVGEAAKIVIPEECEGIPITEI